MSNTNKSAHSVAEQAEGKLKSGNSGFGKYLLFAMGGWFLSLTLVIVLFANDVFIRIGSTDNAPMAVPFMGLTCLLLSIWVSAKKARGTKTRCASYKLSLLAHLTVLVALILMSMTLCSGVSFH